AHDVDNLYVVDGSFFPSSAAVNPALTIMANALRVGDHLLKRLGVSETEYERNRQQDRELAMARKQTITRFPLPVRPHKKLAVICALLLVLPEPQGFAQHAALVDCVGAIGITVSDMDRAVDF